MVHDAGHDAAGHSGSSSSSEDRRKPPVPLNAAVPPKAAVAPPPPDPSERLLSGVDAADIKSKGLTSSKLTAMNLLTLDEQMGVLEGGAAGKGPIGGGGMGGGGGRVDLTSSVVPEGASPSMGGGRGPPSVGGGGMQEKCGGRQEEPITEAPNKLGGQTWAEKMRSSLAPKVGHLGTFGWSWPGGGSSGGAFDAFLVPQLFLEKLVLVAMRKAMWC